MTAVLCGCPWGREQHDLLAHDHKYANEPLNIAYTMQVIDVGSLMDVTAFKKRVDAAINHIKSAERREGVQEILVPGEPEARAMERQLREGIEYPIELIVKAAKISADLGIAPLS
jgi:LDH2 family malate/lactate/ureidoglycolate dehydrogenase